MTVELKTLQRAIALNLRTARLTLQLSQADLAKRASTSTPTISQIEGAIADPKLSTLTSLAASLNLPVFMLFLTERDFARLKELASESESLETPSKELDEISQRMTSDVTREKHQAFRDFGDRQMAAWMAPGAVAGGAIGAFLGGPAGAVFGAVLGGKVAAVSSMHRRTDDKDADK